MANLFRSVPLKKPRRSDFNLSHMVKFSCNAGEDIPILCEPVLPGDSAQCVTEALVRLAPTLYPLYERINVYTHFFFVPTRLIWKDFQDFITGGSDGTLHPEYPTFSVKTTVTDSNAFQCALFQQKGIMSALGIVEMYDDDMFLVNESGSRIPNQSFWPDFISARHKFDLLPIRAYLKIWNDYYRDENLCTDLFNTPTFESVMTASGNFNAIQVSQAMAAAAGGSFGFDNPFARRAWEKDYFTSALPWAQRGANVDIPLGSIDTDNLSVSYRSSSQLMRVVTPSGDPFPVSKRDSPTTRFSLTVGNDGTSAGVIRDNADNSIYGPFNFDPNGTLGISGDASVEPVTINSLRRAFKLQEFLERMARGGSRYIEQIYSHFGVRSSDARLQRPEYLGGGISPVVISEVLQQSQGTESSPLGSFAGHGISATRTHQFRRFFEEHGYIIGIMSIMPKPGYYGGVSRKFMKRDRLDYAWPTFAHLGEQPIYQQEISFDPTSPSDINEDNLGTDVNDKVFGYTPRYAEYKFCKDRVFGDFAGSLDSWHMSRFYGGNKRSYPSLSQQFIYQKPTNRVFADTSDSDDHYWIQLYHNFKMIRPLPKYGVPMF
ncbi:major capsid protein [Dipodfec virus UOA04_Rod_1038]|nr:major capsid protein [Dipodfec virus UOA04_Rod_1038]